MKKIFTSLFFAGFLFANSATTEGMAELEASVNKIQKGFLYNQKSMIIEGVDEMLKVNKTLESVDTAKKFLPDGKKQFTGNTVNIAKKITKLTANLKDHIEKSEYTKASQDYAKIIQKCTACHAIVRGW